MAMATRLRSKMREENAEAVKIIGGKPGASKQNSLDSKEQPRRAFGDIHNKLGTGTATQDKQKTIGAFYKDVKPRVDTRWKKAEIPAQKAGKSSLATVTHFPSLAVTKHLPILKQAKPSAAVETITAQVRRTSKVSTFGEHPALIRKESIVTTELQLIKSPFKLHKAKIEHPHKNFYESHSTKLIHQVEDIDENDAENPQMLTEYHCLWLQNTKN
ncbi:CLUMA_CG008651, isoform B [Clunio marinus]|uniref:CLUMA_CG008651, isoform B n=1 Tax=Clunio marinus TaxID=568069 RepID=A0A1J1I546_9DIPT|nr:CLUMA_CG008651, isoform B [Clunio marinus]